MLNISLQIFAGIGLFFVGITFLSNNIKKLGGKHAPKVIAALAKNDIQSTIAGIVSGFITNSGKAVTFILVGLIEADLISFRKCLPIVMGGSVGSAFIVLWASFNFQIVIYLLLGVAGLYFQFGNRKNHKIKLISGVVLGFGLLFYGLEMIKLGAGPIKSMPWFEHYIVLTQGHWFLELIVGAILALVSQSGSSVAIIAISLVGTGILGVDEAIMLVYGTNVGSGISTALLGLSLKGLARRLVFFHGFFKIIGIVVMVPLLYWEVFGGVPLIKNFVSFYSSNSSLQIALIYLLYEILTAIFVSGLLTPIAYWFETGITHHIRTVNNNDEAIDNNIVSRATQDNYNTNFNNAAVSINPFTGGIINRKRSTPITEHDPVINISTSDDSPENIVVDILYTPGNRFDAIDKMLATHNVTVRMHEEIDSQWRLTLDRVSADILMVIMDDNFPSHDDLMHSLLSESRLPVLFNDAAYLHEKFLTFQKDWLNSLVQKLYNIVGRPMQLVG